MNYLQKDLVSDYAYDTRFMNVKSNIVYPSYSS
jgi:hypothetical protein